MLPLIPRPYYLRSQHPTGSSSRICRGSKVDQDTDSGDWRATGTPTFNPFVLFLTLAFILCIGLLASWLVNPKPPTPSATLVTELRNFHQQVQTLDRGMARLDLELIVIEVEGNLADSATATQYYRKLVEFQTMQDDRTRYAINYNGMVRSYFTNSKNSPTDLAKYSLPPGIR